MAAFAPTFLPSVQPELMPISPNKEPAIRMQARASHKRIGIALWNARTIRRLVLTVRVLCRYLSSIRVLVETYQLQSLGRGSSCSSLLEQSLS